MSIPPPHPKSLPKNTCIIRDDGNEILMYAEYKVTYEPMERYPLEIHDKIVELHEQIYDDPESAIPKLLELRERYPTLPVLCNYLTMAYGNNNEIEKTKFWIKKTYQLFPDYLFAKTNLAHLYLTSGQIEKIEKIFDGKWDLKFLYPDRDVFHITEVTAFYVFMADFHLYKGELPEAKDCLNLLVKLDPEHPQIPRLQKIFDFKKTPMEKLKNLIFKKLKDD